MSKLITLRTILSIFIFLLCSKKQAYAQDTTLTIKDAGEITYKSEQIVKEFKDLLNIISSTETDTKETKDLITNSFSNSKNKIFYNSAILVEDDINPSAQSSENAKEVTIEKYLNDLDLLYKKSDTPSISFIDLHISNVKKGDYMYVKVFFHSLFSTVNATIDGAYNKNNRLAEIRVDKVNNKWQAAIVRVGFFNPVDTVNDITNNVMVVGNSTDNSQTSFDEQLQEQERQKQIDEYKSQKEKYNRLIEDGDKALTANDYTAALKAYSEAGDESPYELYPKIKINQLRKLIEQSSISDSELFKQFLAKARLAEKNRQYTEAKEYYLSALQKKPEGDKDIDAHLKSLTDKIRILTEPNEKYASGLYNDAIKDYDRITKKDNTNSDYYLGRAKCYDKLNNYSKALKDYSQSIDLDNNNLEAIRLRAALYAKNQEYFKALTDYKVYLTLDKSNVDIYINLSLAHALTNNLTSAVSDLDEGISALPKAASLYYQKGLLLHQNNRYKDAYNNFTNALQINPSDPSAYYYRGLCLIKMNNIEKAASDFETARSKNLDSNSFYSIESIAKNYSDSSSLFFSSNPPNSLRYISNAILVNPYQKIFRFARGEVYFSKKEFEMAITNYTDAISLDTTYETAYYKRAYSYYNLNNYKMAESDFGVCKHLNPSDIYALVGLGNSDYFLDNFQVSVYVYENVLGLINSKKVKLEDSIKAVVYNRLSKSYYETGNYDKAIENGKNAIRINDNYAEAYFNRGRAYFKKGSLDEASGDITKAVGYQNSNNEWTYTLANVYLQKKEYQNASSSYSQVLQSNSSDGYNDGYYYRGFSYLQIQNYSKALEDYQKSIALGLDTLSGSFYSEAGDVYLNLNQYDSARNSYQKVYDRDNASGKACYGIAMALYMSTKKEEAYGWFEKAFQSKSYTSSMVKKDKMYDSLKDDKAFRTLMKKYL